MPSNPIKPFASIPSLDQSKYISDIKDTFKELEKSTGLNFEQVQEPEKAILDVYRFRSSDSIGPNLAAISLPLVNGGQCFGLMLLVKEQRLVTQII